MPSRALRPCAKCRRKLTATRYCEGCAPKVEQEARAKSQRYERWRGSAASRGYDRNWQRASKAFLVEHPLCADPYKIHYPSIVAAECVDHIEPHKGDMLKFWDKSNWQPLCIPCNSLKAIREEGGFGNAMKS